MDAFTYKHLWNWLETQFREDEIENAYACFVPWLEDGGFDETESWPTLYRRFENATTLTVPRY